MPIVAEVTISRKFSVGLTMPVLYKNNSDASVPKVSPTACMTMPGYCASKTAEIAPKNKPSAIAYSGAVMPECYFLNMVIRAKTRPAMAPPTAQGMTFAGLPLEKNIAHV